MSEIVLRTTLKREKGYRYMTSYDNNENVVILKLKAGRTLSKAEQYLDNKIALKGSEMLQNDEKIKDIDNSIDNKEKELINTNIPNLNDNIVWEE